MGLCFVKTDNTAVQATVVLLDGLGHAKLWDQTFLTVMSHRQGFEPWTFSFRRQTLYHCAIMLLK